MHEESHCQEEHWHAAANWRDVGQSFEIWRAYVLRHRWLVVKRDVLGYVWNDQTEMTCKAIVSPSVLQKMSDESTGMWCCHFYHLSHSHPWSSLLVFLQRQKTLLYFLFFFFVLSLFHINSWGRCDSGWVTGVKRLHPTNWVIWHSNYVLKCWLSWQDVERMVSVLLGGGLPSQGPLFKTVFQ